MLININVRYPVAPFFTLNVSKRSASHIQMYLVSETFHKDSSFE